jgi:hypothetical protein
MSSATSHLDTKQFDNPGIAPISETPVNDASRDKRTASNDQSHHTALGIFQDLVGIRTPKGILYPHAPSNPPDLHEDVASDQSAGQYAPGGRPKRESLFKLFFTTPQPNRGIYGRAIDEEWKSRVGFQVTRHCISSIYILQIFIAATITGLAAFDGTKVGLTILGAANTVLAGLMAYLNSQGLPNRMLKARDQYRNVIDTIEDTERFFCRIAQISPPTLTKNPFEEADKIVALYNAAKKAQQDNYPDNYVGTQEKPKVQGSNGATDQNVAKRLEELEKKAAVSDSLAA